MVKTIESLAQLKSWTEYRDYMKESLKLVDGEAACFVSKDKIDFDLEGKPWKGHVFLAGKKAVLLVQQLKKEGVIFREGVCTAEGKDLRIGKLEPAKLFKEVEKTFLKLRLGYKLHATVDENVVEGSNSTVTLGEPEVGKQIALAPLRYGGSVHGKIWGMANPAGVLARGGGTQPLKDLAAMNTLADMALRGIADMEQLDGQWRTGFKTVQRAAETAGKELKQFDKAVPAMKDRMKKDPDFFRDVDGYLRSMEEAEAVVGKIRKAEKDFETASHELEAAVFATQADEVGKQAEEVKGNLEELQHDIEEAKKIFGAVVEVAGALASKDWVGAATKAISFLGEEAIDAAYAPQLTALKQQLATAEKELGRLKSNQLKSLVEAKRAGVESAVIALENTQTELQTALGRLARTQANANNELNESPSTAIAGKLITQRVKQLNAVAEAQHACRRYLDASKRATGRMQQIVDQFRNVGTWLDKSAKADPAFRRPSPYTNMLEKSALSNSIELADWNTWVNDVGRKCTAALTWVDDSGPKGPMAPFKQAVDLIKTGLSG